MDIKKLNADILKLIAAFEDNAFWLYNEHNRAMFFRMVKASIIDSEKNIEANRMQEKCLNEIRLALDVCPNTSITEFAEVIKRITDLSSVEAARQESVIADLNRKNEFLESEAERYREANGELYNAFLKAREEASTIEKTWSNRCDIAIEEMNRAIYENTGSQRIRARLERNVSELNVEVQFKDRVIEEWKNQYQKALSEIDSLNDLLSRKNSTIDKALGVLNGE